MDSEAPRDARWTSGPSFDGKGEFSVSEPAPPLGQEPTLQKAPPEVHAGLESTGPGGTGVMGRFVRTMSDRVTPS